MSVAPATRERPRIVTPEAIEIFETRNPALKGIGSIMVDLGIWVVENSEKTASKDSERAPAKARSKDTQHQQGAMNVDNYCISEAV
ncbi:MAG: hypothetical protein CVV35_00310 [Methanomicrobiales archaeon HGW-Methanomicrobiales-6]|jgi:hypothetical protein|nr:MAG: hypothetical protein CVV35_00310 [Methanomicrobiales archaeon HGW-Methanomicrobiales-6]